MLQHQLLVLPLQHRARIHLAALLLQDLGHEFPLLRFEGRLDLAFGEEKERVVGSLDVREGSFEAIVAVSGLSMK